MARLFLPAATNLVTDPQGTAQTFWPADTANTDTTANQALPVALSGSNLSHVDTCLMLVNNGTADAPETANITVSASTSYTTSLYVYIPQFGGNVTITAENGHTFSVAALTGANADWVRYSAATNTVAGETTLKLKFAFAGGTPTTLYVTAAMLEASPIPTPFFSGASTDSLNASTYAWTGTPNASTSTRAASRLALPFSVPASGTVAMRLTPTFPAASGQINQVFSLASAGASWSSIVVNATGTPYLYYYDGASLTSINAGVKNFLANTTHAIVGRFVPAASLDLMFDGSAAAQVAHALTAAAWTSFSFGTNATQPNLSYIGPVLVSPQRKSDAWTTAVDALLRAATVDIPLLKRVYMAPGDALFTGDQADASNLFVKGA